jgi:gamma-glutamyl-gamma-aminobutyrate hydrolase PuuD
MHFINVFFGGSLVQNIPDIDPLRIHVSPGIHNVKIIDDELLNELGSKSNESVQVNSYHNSGVLTGTLGKDLKIFSLLEEINLVEGLFHEQYPIAALEWHPERKKPQDLLDKIITNAFINKTLFWKMKSI